MAFRINRNFADHEVYSPDLRQQHGFACGRGDGSSWAGGHFGFHSYGSRLGSRWDDTLVGNRHDNILIGRGGDDTLIGRAGDDRLFGGAGVDTAVVSGARADYAWDPEAQTLTDLRDGAPDGTDTLHGVEFVRFADALVAVEDLAGGTTIMQIQGAGHLSPFDGQEVTTSGVVTAIAADGFFMQDPAGDGDDATSDAIFVCAAGALPAVGDGVAVTGLVMETGAPGALTQTQIAATEVVVRSSGNVLPDAVVLGVERGAPGAVIDDDGLTSFDPATDAIDFFESLEGMRVAVADPLVVAGVNADGEVGLAAGRGGEAGPGTVNAVVASGDAQAEVLVTGTRFAAAPDAATGDTFAGDPVGILDQTADGYRLQLTATPEVVAGGRLPETTILNGSPTGMTVALLDAAGLDAGDGDIGGTGDAFDYLASLIVDTLSSPDVIVLRGVQDDSGALDNGTVKAGLTLTKLINAVGIHDLTSPFYMARSLDPVDNADGGEAGTNERVVFLFNPTRVGFVNGSMTRIDDPAFAAGGDGSPEQAGYLAAQKPLVADFIFKPTGETVTLIGTELSSAAGDDGAWGDVQLPVEHTLAQRIDQADAINAFVADRLASDPDVKLVVAGNLNDDPFSDTLDRLLTGGDASAEMHSLLDDLPANDAYSFVEDGVSSAPDQILVGGDFAPASVLDMVHANLDFGVQPAFVADHDPLVALIDMRDPDTLVG